MKKARIVGLLVIIALLFALVPAASAGPPPGNWISGITCQNLSTTEQADLFLYFYQEDNSSPALTFDDKDLLDPGDSRLYFTPDTPKGVPEGFLGSVVVASNTPLACNVNTQTTGQGTPSDPWRVGTSAGFADTQTAPTMYAPQVMKNLAGTWSSYIAVQNTTTSDTNVTVTYRDKSGNAISAATETALIKAQSNKVFYQNDNSGLPNGFLGAAKIAADDGTSGLAVTVNFYNSGSSASTAQLHSYNGFSSGADKLLVPRFVRNYYAYNGGLTIQNLGTGDTEVSITFKIGGNTYVYDSDPIKANAALALYAPDIDELDPVDSLLVQNRVGNAVVQVTSGGPIVAIVNEDNRGGSGVPAALVGQGSTYNAMNDGTQSSTVFFAQITNNAGGIFSGGFNVANTTGTAGTCDITYNDDTGTSANELDVNLPANGFIKRYAPDVPNLDDRYNSSVTVTCTQPVVGISNLAVNQNSGLLGDSFTTGNGLNQ